MFSSSNSFYATLLSRSEEFNDSDYMETMANDWSPETGFISEELKLKRDSYPKPAIGRLNRNC